MLPRSWLAVLISGDGDWVTPSYDIQKKIPALYAQGKKIGANVTIRY